MYDIKFSHLWICHYVVACALFFWCGFAFAVPEDASSVWAEQSHLVRDLMRLEAEKLVAPSPVQKETSQLSSHINSDGPPQLYLRAMYGVGQRILAEVDFNGKTYLYLKGQTWPVGGELEPDQLRLVAMTAQCIELAYKEQSMKACVTPKGGQP
ncbi:hypothetical protein [uncultured Paenalcaligenes sp.]|uniref:hypothetical protein n=1 Tax=uncultured Paenalcaligenes sp. TaxID=1588925 RepID=UPI00261FD9CB|nr:hypothetical protein [uncultured Paenalcaligenes sp.]